MSDSNNPVQPDEDEATVDEGSEEAFGDWFDPDEAFDPNGTVMWGEHEGRSVTHGPGGGKEPHGSTRIVRVGARSVRIV